MPHSAPLPALDEKVTPIVIGRRFATPQEARAIAALEAAMDDQPAPYNAKAVEPKPFDMAFEASAIDIVMPAEALAVPKEIMPTYRASAGGETITQQEFKEASYQQVDVQVMAVNTGSGAAPMFVAPAFERLETPAPAAVDKLAQNIAEIKKQTEILLAAAHADAAQWGMKLAAAEVAATVAAPVVAAEPVKTNVIVDVMPFGQATLRLFCY